MILTKTQRNTVSDLKYRKNQLFRGAIHRQGQSECTPFSLMGWGDVDVSRERSVTIPSIFFILLANTKSERLAFFVIDGAGLTLIKLTAS